MAITINTLVTFVFTILFIVYSVHCDTAVTTDDAPFYGGMKIDDVCVNIDKPCEKAGGVLKACDDFCTEHYLVGGYCNGQGKCCCIHQHQV
ncbi:unnamed protein product [Brassica rapa subsp. narinosa]